MIHLDPGDGSPLYRQIIDQVKRMIMVGHLAPGDQIESVASLASRVRINPMTVSKAYSALVEAGVLERRRGVGLFVAAGAAMTTKDDREEMLDHELRGAAAVLVQLGISEDEASRRLRAHMRTFHNGEGNDHE